MKVRSSKITARKSSLSLFTNFILAALLLIAAAPLQLTKAQDTKPLVRRAVKSDVSPQLRLIKPIVVNKKDKADDDRGGGPVNDTRHDPDQALQSFTGNGIFNQNNLVPPVGVSFDGLFNPAPPPFTTGAVPPDPVGDIGTNHYVQMVNSQFQIFSRTGTSLYGPANINTLFTGFGGACETENAGDPVVLYDQLADRWLLSQFTGAGPTYFNCVALSTTSDPLGSYQRYAFPAGAAGTNFPDYPKYGVWSDAYYISTREFAGNSFAGIGAYALNRDQMLAGSLTPQVVSFLRAPTVATDEFLGDGLLPADLDGNVLPPAGRPNYFVGTMDSGVGTPYGASADAINVFEFRVNWANPASSTFSLTPAFQLNTAAFDSIFPCAGGSTPARNCIAQPGTATRIDVLSYRQRPLHRLAYRNLGTHESLVTSQSVEATTGVAGMRWYELRLAPNGTPSIFQQGTYAPADSINRWMGSAAMDRTGNIGMAYSVSDATSVFPGLRFTGRLSNDTLGTMPQGEGVIVNGGGSQTSTSSRWGDYSSINIDPINDCTFWYTNQYYSATSARGWKTRIGSFRFPECTSSLISGAITYATTPVGQPTKFVPGAVLTASIGFTLNVNTNASGFYQFDDLAIGGRYTVTPSKTGGANGISALDATLILRHVASQGTGPNALNANQRIAGDADGNGSLSPLDATSVLRYVSTQGQQSAQTGQTGNWRFLVPGSSPPANSRVYNPLSSNQTLQNYLGFLIGDVDGTWTP